MFATVAIAVGAPERYVTLPQSAITFNPYGSTVYLVDDTAKDAAGKPILTARQNFVTTGDTRGDQVAVLKGVEVGQNVVTSGQMKLRNGSPIKIDNTVQPSNDPNPTPVRAIGAPEMNFTDIFVRRPVLATVLSLMILVLGLRAGASLPILQFPKTENAVVTVTTTYYGADPDVVAGFITTPLENAIAQADGIDYMTSTSQSSTSTITVNLRLNYDPDKALTEITSKVTSVVNQLPPGAQQPVLSIKIGQTFDALYIGFKSDVLAQNEITDYLVRVVQPKLQAVDGVQTAELVGGENFALRAWLDPEKMAAYGVTAADVSQALASNDYIAGLGNTKGQMVQVNLTASTNLHSRRTSSRNSW